MTQCAKVLKHMRDHGRISTLDAFRFYNITRLSARIWDLKHDGYDIVSETVSHTTEGHTIRYAVYSLKEVSDDKQD